MQTTVAQSSHKPLKALLRGAQVFHECTYNLLETDYHKPLRKVDSKSKIVFLGYFLSEQNYVCCRTANDKFLEYVSGVAISSFVNDFDQNERP